MAWSSSRESRTLCGMRHMVANRRLRLTMCPSGSTTRMPSVVDSRVAESSDSVPRRSSSTRRRSVMSRTKPVKAGGSLPGTRLIASSTGNSVPSARIAVISTRRPSIVVAPVARWRAKPSWCRARSAGGTIRPAIGRPITASRW